METNIISRFNKFEFLPYIPYKIAVKLLENENLFKLLKYNDYECISKPNLTYDEKIAMIWKDQSNMADYYLYLTNIEPDELIKSKTILKIYKYDTLPVSPMISTISYKIDILCGTKNTLVNYNGVPCSRLDTIEMEILKSLNGEDVAGVGYLQFNHELSRLSRSMMTIGNNYTFTGTTMVMSTQLGVSPNTTRC